MCVLHVLERKGFFEHISLFDVCGIHGSQKRRGYNTRRDVLHVLFHYATHRIFPLEKFGQQRGECILVQDWSLTHCASTDCLHVGNQRREKEKRAPKSLHLGSPDCLHHRETNWNNKLFFTQGSQWSPGVGLARLSHVGLCGVYLFPTHLIVPERVVPSIIRGPGDRDTHLFHIC